LSIKIALPEGRLARLYTDLGSVFAASKNRDEAEAWYQKSLDVWLELQSQHALWMSEMNMPSQVEARLSQERLALH